MQPNLPRKSMPPAEGRRVRDGHHAEALQDGGSQACALRLPARCGLQVSLPLAPHVSRVPLGDLGPAWWFFKALHETAVEHVCLPECIFFLTNPAHCSAQLSSYDFGQKYYTSRYRKQSSPQPVVQAAELKHLTVWYIKKKFIKKLKISVF